VPGPYPGDRPPLLVAVPDDRWKGLWPDGDEPVRITVWDLHGPAPAEPPSFVVLPYLDLSVRMSRLGELVGLRVVQTLTAGFDQVLPQLPPGVTLCNAAGVHDASTAELAVGLTIAALRGIGDFARAQDGGRWLSGTRTALADRSVLLVGVGSVGTAIVRRLEPFEVRITRVAGHARVDQAGQVHGSDELAWLLPHHDVVVLACPLTASTRGMVDAAFLAAMPDGALLVNVARGPVVVTDALTAELGSGRLRAALDVTDPEPLPADHPLWSMPGVLISPHVGGDTTAFPPRARALLREQLTRFAAGRMLLNVVAGPAS
jgi:phosphoglycerate dehydrogenase-like enzyme